MARGILTKPIIHLHKQPNMNRIHPEHLREKLMKHDPIPDLSVTDGTECERT